jgi:pyridoxine kinase
MTLKPSASSHSACTGLSQTDSLLTCRILTGVKITSQETLKAALSSLHELYDLPYVVLSSVRFPDSPDTLYCAGSTRSTGRIFVITFPRLSPHFEGVGDVFSALVLANFDTEGGDDALSNAVLRAIRTLRAILLRTERFALELVNGDRAKLADPAVDGRNETQEERTRRLACVELRLVQSWEDIRSPPDDGSVRLQFVW